MFLRVLTALVLTFALLLGAWQPEVGAAPGQKPYLVFIVMDGFRPDYATLAPMRHLRALMARGMTYDTAWVGQLESETPTSHATMGTGVYPRRHGVVGFGWRDTSTGGFVYMPTDLNQIRAGKLTQQIEAAGVPTLSDLVHARSRKDIVIAVSGEKYYAASTIGAGADYVLFGRDVKDVFRPLAVGPNIPPAKSGYLSITGDSSLDKQDDFASRLAVQLVKTMRPRALLLNLPDPDIAGHYYGGMSDPKDMAAIAAEVDGAIGRVVNTYRRLGILNRTLFVVTSDHGMAANLHTVPIHSIYAAVAQTHIDNIDQELRASLGSIWLRGPQGAASLASAIVAKHFPGVEGALYKDAMGTFVPEASTVAHLSKPLLHAYVDLANTEAGPTGPDVLLPYSEDTIGWATHAKLGKHGGFSWGVQHIPLVLAGPGVRRGVSHFPAQLVDIAPTIEQLIGLPVPKNVDGVVLADASGPSMSQVQIRAQKLRLPDIKAIRAHSVAQTVHRR